MLVDRVHKGTNAEACARVPACAHLCWRLWKKMLVTTAPRGSSTAKHLSCNTTITSHTKLPAGHRKWHSQEGMDTSRGNVSLFCEPCNFETNSFQKLALEKKKS